MKAIPDTPDTPDTLDERTPNLETRASSFALLQSPQPEPPATKSATLSPVAGNADVTVVTVVHKTVFAQSGYWHGGINE